MSEPSAKRRKTGGNDGTRITDPRFANIQSDPRYRLPSKKQKVKLDSRFTKNFRGEDFTRRAKVDRYGRRIENDAEQRRLAEKFDLEDDEDLSDEPDDDDEIEAELARVEQRHDPLREGKDVSSSEDDSSTDEDSGESEAEDVEETSFADQKEDVPQGEVSTRIAVVNLDWDNIRAADLMAVVSSFLPAGGRLIKVSVYPSEFGKERMEREEMEGPPQEIFAQKAEASGSDPESGSDEDIEEEDDEDIKASIIRPDDGSEFDSQALRQYQLERLRYYYAVLTFSSKQIAKSIYDAIDGAEYLSTANFFDLRFIPEGTDFSEDKPRDECEHLPTGYKPNEFVTDALQHSKVKLTWDAEDLSRKEAQARAFKGGQKEIDENDLKAYLGSDTSEGEDEDEDNQQMIDLKEAPTSKKDSERLKARALLGLAPEPSKKSSKKEKDAHVGDIQITFSSGLSGAANGEGKKRSVFENSPEPQETTVERYKRKEKERKQKRKEKMKAGRTGETATADSDNESVVAAADTKDGGLGFDDPFFAEAANDNPKHTNKVRKEERLKKRREREAEEAASAKQRAELELLMADNDNESAVRTGATGNGHAVRHFDMNEIEKAEKGKNKWQKRKEKKNKRGQADGDDDGAVKATIQDDFQMDTTDARFGKLFENHEFAIDPTNPGLRKTKAMKELMEEGRRRKDTTSKSRSAKTDVEGVDTVAKSGKARGDKSQGNGTSKGNTVSEVRDLVAKIKRKGQQ